jgi:hypothetical protein
MTAHFARRFGRPRHPNSGPSLASLASLARPSTSLGMTLSLSKVTAFASAPLGPAMSEARQGRVEWSGRRGSNPRPTAWKAVTLPLSYSRLRPSARLHPSARSGLRQASPVTHRQLRRVSRHVAASPVQFSFFTFRRPFDSALRASLRALSASMTRLATSEPRSGESSGEGRIRTSEAARATDLQSAAFDRFATSPLFAPALLIHAPGAAARSVSAGSTLCR